MSWRALTQAEIGASLLEPSVAHEYELRVEQVTPACGAAGRAFVRIDARRGAEAESLHLGLPRHVRSCLSLRRGDRSGRHGAGLDPAATYLEICPDDAEDTADYGDIHRALAEFAPLLEDCRFFVAATEDGFVDEYRVEAGLLRLHRHDSGAPGEAALRRCWNKLSRTCPDDHDLKDFLARRYADDGEALARVAEDPERRAEAAPRALAALAEALAFDPASARALRLKAELHRSLGDDVEAAACLDRLLALAPADVPALELALLAFAVGREDDALNLLRRLADADRSRLAHQLAGALHSRADDPWLADQAFRAALELTPDSSPRNPWGEALLRTGRAAAVLLPYFDHVSATPGDPQRRVRVVGDLVEWAGLLRERAGDGALARELLERAIELGDSDGHAHHGLGLLHARAGQRDQATRCFQQAVAVNPGHVGAHGELAAAALARGERQAALIHLRACVEHDATSELAGQQQVLRLFDNLYAEANHQIDVVRDPQAAEALFDEIIALAPSLPPRLGKFEGAWVGKANARAWRGDQAGSLECADRALELSPTSGYAWSARGNALNNLRRFREALECYEHATAAEPGYWHPYYCKACTLALTGQDRREIYALVRKALELAPERAAMFRAESDFSSLRGDPAFHALFERAAPRRR